ncbi:hypothetical protein IQ06DRAFT_336264 [Phaeosphaeriaceae sp. SRC1lsM3a]|nr:hypothetical protein IQ06DRAFT_336264 [Stagonospora sp. SRC1lsM3a]
MVFNEVQSNLTRSSPTKLQPAHPPRPAAECTSSISDVDHGSHYHDPAQWTAALQCQLHAQLERVADRPDESIKNHVVTPRYSGQDGVDDLNSRPPTFQWYARDDHSLGTHLYKSTGHQDSHHSQTPLKPCLKTKANSATTSPPGLSRAATYQSSEGKTLRRSKTVEFEMASKSLLFLQPAALPPSKMMDDSHDCASERTDRTHLHNNGTSQISPYHNMLGTAKSQLAGPATTHTDVHVIAITPSKSADDEPRKAGQKTKADPATPTMQVVESKSGYYEVIWDDIPTEHSVSTTRRRSSATASLSAASSTAARGLQRVNSKLTDWSSSWNAPSATFNPTIVVFPDDDGKTISLGNTINDDDSDVPVPPNSQRTSASHSRISSRPASVPLTRASSREQLPTDNSVQTGSIETKQNWVAPLENALSVPQSDMRSTYMLNSNRKCRQGPTYRKLSNIEEADLRFRGHRDSVTLAHARLMRSGGLSPELFAHRDSISMAKKRMHARNYAVSDANNISMPKRRDTPRLPVMSLDDSILPLTAAGEYAVPGLDSQKPRSILGTQKAESLRHVRISE